MWLSSDGYNVLPDGTLAVPPPLFRFAVCEGLDETYLPVRGDSRATGWDVRASHDVMLRPFEHTKIKLGIRCFAPEGWWLELRPRSSTFAKKHLASLYGVIDESYEGEIMFACQWVPPHVYIPSSEQYEPRDHRFELKAGERIGQLVPVRRQEMSVQGVTNEEFDRLCEQRGLERGAGGFGSTGK